MNKMIARVDPIRLSPLTVQMTQAQLRAELALALVSYGYTVERFLGTPIDDLESYSLRDLWLMTHGLV